MIKTKQVKRMSEKDNRRIGIIEKRLKRKENREEKEVQREGREEDKIVAIEDKIRRGAQRTEKCRKKRQQTRYCLIQKK